MALQNSNPTTGKKNNVLNICVFWLDQNGDPQKRSFSSSLDKDPLGDALKFSNAKRAEGGRHVVMSTENSDQVGQMGVDSIVDGKTPDGHDYTWKKRRV